VVTITAHQLKQFAIEKGAELVGVAPVERFAEAPAGHHPGDILEGAKSVVVCGRTIPLGVLYGPASSYDRTMGATHSRLDHLAVEIALFLEREGGGRSIPVPADEPYHYWEDQRSYGRGDLSHKHAAQAAGLGKLGKNSLFIHPELGNLVQLVSVVTDIELEADPLPDWEPCPKKCTVCFQVCPAGAIGENMTVNQALCREVLMVKLSKGRIIEGCGACRRSCPPGAKQIEIKRQKK
jgi:epoxyqueuosine reductase